ncbi:hypothetical protein V8C40DRAFT_264847 [Trichoderma camerunense]
MGSETSEGWDTVMSSDETEGPVYRACADAADSIDSLAGDISYPASVLADHYKEKILDFHPRSLGYRQILIPQPPKKVRKARDDVINSAFKILELTAGPSGMISIAMSQVQFIGALKWLLHFKIFDRISEDAEVEYDRLANEAEVPVSLLKAHLTQPMGLGSGQAIPSSSISCSC